MTDPDRVGICWIDDPDSGEIHRLIFHSPVRMRILPRDEASPFFDEGSEAITWMAGHPGEQCQVSINAIRQWWPDEQLDE